MKKVRFPTIWVICCFALAAACTLGPQWAAGDLLLTATASEATVSTISSKLAASSLQELAHYADLVIIGRAVAKEGTINGARDLSDVSKPDPRIFSIGQLYRIEVDQTIKGETLKTLLVAQKQGFLSLESGARPTTLEIEAEVQRNEGKTFIPLSLDRQYLFFLRLLDNGNYELDGYPPASLYAGVMEPWRFEITGDQTAAPETLSASIRQLFPAVSLDELLESLDQPYVPGQAPKPPYPPPQAEAPIAPAPYP